MGKENAKKKDAGRLQKLGKKVKSLDIFGEGVGFNIGDGQSTHTTYFGSLLTLAIIVITFTYALKRYNVMIEYGDTVVQTITEVNEVTRESLLEQDESKFNLMFNLFEVKKDGSLGVPEEGYIDLRLY